VKQRARPALALLKQRVHSAFTAPKLRGRSRAFTLKQREHLAFRAKQREPEAFTLLPKLRDRRRLFRAASVSGCRLSRHSSLATCHSVRQSEPHAFTLLELLVVMGIIAVLMVLIAPAFTNIGDGKKMGRAINDVANILELARAEAMSTRSYVYVGFANPTNSGTLELKVAALISIDGSSNTASTNLRPLTRVLTTSGILMTNYTNLPASVKAAADASLQTNSDYVINFATTNYFQGKFADSAFNTSCPTVTVSPQGEVLNPSNPVVFFRTTTSIGLVPTHGTSPISTDGGIVSYYGGTGQLRLTRPKS
jgi:prepilin-type N-terminal cleavage/methylation domain-containing protein